MKKIIIIALLCMPVAKLFCQQIKKVKIEEITVYMQSSNHPMVINFWATWCKPCIEELPSLQEAVQKNKDASVELVLVSLDFPEAYPDSIVSFIKRRNIRATFFWLNETDADHFCPAIDKEWYGTIPVTLLFNKNKYRKFFDRKINQQELNEAMSDMLK